MFIIFCKTWKKNSIFCLRNSISNKKYRFNECIKPRDRKCIKISSVKTQLYSISKLSITLLIWEVIIVDPTMFNKFSRDLQDINFLTTTQMESILFEWIEPRSGRNIFFFKENIISKWACCKCIVYISRSYNSLGQEFSDSQKEQGITFVFYENNIGSLLEACITNSSECVGTRNIHETLWTMRKYMENMGQWKFFGTVKIDLFQNIV